MKTPDFPHATDVGHADPQLACYEALADDVLWLLEVGPPKRAQVPREVLDLLEQGIAELGRFVERMPMPAHAPAIDI